MSDGVGERTQVVSQQMDEDEDDEKVNELNPALAREVHFLLFSFFKWW